MKGKTGQFYDQNLKEISGEEALDHATPAGQVHSHSRDVKHEQTIQHCHDLGFG